MDRKDVFRLPSSFWDEDNLAEGKEGIIAKHQCPNETDPKKCAKTVPVLPIFSDRYKKNRLREMKPAQLDQNIKLTKFHIHGKNARVEHEYEYEYEPEYLVDFDIGANGEIKHKIDPSTGKPKYFYDSTGKRVVKKDSEGNTIYKLNHLGMKVPLKDENGKIVYKLDPTGQMVIKKGNKNNTMGFCSSHGAYMRNIYVSLLSNQSYFF